MGWLVDEKVGSAPTRGDAGGVVVLVFFSFVVVVVGASFRPVVGWGRISSSPAIKRLICAIMRAIASWEGSGGRGEEDEEVGGVGVAGRDGDREEEEGDGGRHVVSVGASVTSFFFSDAISWICSERRSSWARMGARAVSRAWVSWAWVTMTGREARTVEGGIMLWKKWMGDEYVTCVHLSTLYTYAPLTLGRTCPIFGGDSVSIAGVVAPGVPTSSLKRFSSFSSIVEPSLINVSV